MTDMYDVPIQVRINERPLKTLEPVELTAALVAAAGNAPLLADAVSWAMVAHEGQSRAPRGRRSHKAPYLEHPLRCALRLQRMGVTDTHVLIAAVLHDTIEDGAERLCSAFGLDIHTPAHARRVVAGYISRHFGIVVTETVLGVSNPLKTEPDPRTVEQKNADYVAHLEDALQTPAQVLVKLSDFVDNAGSLRHTTDLPNRDRRAGKYLLALPVLRSKLGLLRASQYALLCDEFEAILDEIEGHLLALRDAEPARA